MIKNALILAGGRGNRMGGCDKIQLVHNNSTFLQKIMSALSDYRNIYISLNKNQILERSEERRVGKSVG